MNRSFKAAKDVVMDILYPRKCVFCNRTMEVRSYRRLKMGEIYDGLCSDCREDSVYVDEPLCMKCGKEIESREGEYCYDCQRRKHIYDRGVAVFKYSDKVRKSIYRFKYSGHKIYGDFYGKEMHDRYREIITLWKPEAIIPVPIYRGKFRKRGYNQAELIGKRLAELTGIPIDTYILTRSRNTIPQKELNYIFRKKNVENAFKVTGSVVKYNKIILVDDIYTTGCTIDACARVLKNAGVKEVYFITICIGQGI